MKVYITQVSLTDYTEEMPLGHAEIESIEHLAVMTDAEIKKLRPSEFILTCEWGNGNGRDLFRVVVE